MKSIAAKNAQVFMLQCKNGSNPKLPKAENQGHPRVWTESISKRISALLRSLLSHSPTLRVLIDRSVGYTKKAGIFFGPPKGGNPRTVTFSPGTIAILKEWKTQQEARGISSKYVFTEKNSPKIMFPQTPTKYFREVGRRCGIEHFHPHKLRHTFASLNITEGADIASVSEILGHANKSTTLRIYTHSNGQKKHELSQDFHESIHGKEP